MAPRRPDRTTRSGASHKTPGTQRSNQNDTNIGVSTEGTIARNNETLSKSPDLGPAEELDLDDICSDLSSSPPTPRQGIKEVESGPWAPSQSANTSKVESGVGPLRTVAFPGIPTGALQTTGNNSGRPRVLLGTLVRDRSTAVPNASAFSLLLDQRHPTFSPPGPPPLFQQPDSALLPSDHEGSDADVIFSLSPPFGFTAAGPPRQQPEESTVMHRALTHTPTRAKSAIATSSPMSSTLNFAPHSSCAPSSPQRSTILTDIRPCTPDYSPPASPLHQRAPSEITIDLCFTLGKRRGSLGLQSSPLSSPPPQYPEDSNRAPPISAVIPSPTISCVEISETHPHKSPESVPTNAATDDYVASTSPISSLPAVHKLELGNCVSLRPLHTVKRGPNTPLQTVLAQRAVQPPFPSPSVFYFTSPPLDDVINQGSEGGQEEGRGTPTSTSCHKQEKEQEEREDTPLSHIVSETTQEETRSTSGDSFVLSPTSPILQSPSKIPFASSSNAYQVALGQKSVLQPVSTSLTAGSHGGTRVVGVGVDQLQGLPTPSVRKLDSVTLKTPMGLLEEEVTFYASIRKRRIFRKGELAASQAQSNLLIQSCAPLPALTDNEEVAEEPIQWSLYPKRPKVMRVVADSDAEGRPTSEPSLPEQHRQRWQRLPLVQSSSPATDPRESEEKNFPTTLGSTAAAPIVLDSEPETEVDIHPLRDPSMISISSGDEVREEEAEAELPITTVRRQHDSTVPAPKGGFLYVEVPTFRQVQRARAKAAGKSPRDWTGKVDLRKTSWTLGVAPRTCLSPKKPRLLPPSSPSEDELNWDDRYGQKEDGGLITGPDYTEWLQHAHAKRFGYANTLKDFPSSLPPPLPARTSPKKRKRLDTDGEGDTDELDEWVPEPIRPDLRRRVALDTETESATDDNMLHPALSIKRPRTIDRGGSAVVQFQCLIPGASFSRPPAEPLRSTVTQANASIDPSTIRAPKFTSRAPGSSFGCHNCRSSTDRNVKVRCSNSDQDTGGQCMHHWCERCLVLWYGFDGRGLLSAYAFSGEELGPKEIKALGGHGVDGGVGLGLGVVPGKWICPNCSGKCMCTYCTKKDGRSRSRFKRDIVGIPLDLEGLEGLEGAPGLRGIRPKERKKPPVGSETSVTQSITPNLVSAAGFSTQNGESSSSTPAPLLAKRPRITRELQDLLTPEFGHAMHINDHGEVEIYKQDAAGNVVCVGVPTRMRTRACPDGAPESMGGVGVSATELYKPVFLPGERERWRREVGLGEESAGSDSEVDVDRSVSREVEHGLVEGSEGLLRRANFVNVPWGTKLPQAQKRFNLVVQNRPEEDDITPVAARPSRSSVEHSRNVSHHVEPVLSRFQTDLSSLLNVDAEPETNAGNIDFQGDRRFTNTEVIDIVSHAMEPDTQVPSTSFRVPPFPQPALDPTATQEWGGWETMALEFGDPSFNPLPSCDPLTTGGVSTVPTSALGNSSQTVPQ